MLTYSMVGVEHTHNPKDYGHCNDILLDRNDTAIKHRNTSFNPQRVTYFHRQLVSKYDILYNDRCGNLNYTDIYRWILCFYAQRESPLSAFSMPTPTHAGPGLNKGHIFFSLPVVVGRLTWHWREGTCCSRRWGSSRGQRWWRRHRKVQLVTTGDGKFWGRGEFTLILSNLVIKF